MVRGHPASRPLYLLISLLLLLGLAIGSAGQALADDCAETNAVAYQPTRTDAQSALVSAASGRLGGAYPAMPSLAGSQTGEAAFAPCVIVQAVAWMESSWRQAATGTAMGAYGPVLTGKGGCGYGLMQVSSGMTFAGQLPRDIQLSIAQSYVYNAAQGVKILGEKWNATPAIGDRNPAIIEHWYYALWAYNSWSWKNNPNNPIYPWPRPHYDGTQPAKNYPYQELILGLVANPPKSGGVPLWQASAVELPNRDLIGQTPPVLPAPAQPHVAVCPLPSVGNGGSFPLRLTVPAALSFRHLLN